MHTSIATVSIGGDLREKLSAIAAAGFDGVEIFEADFLAFDGTPAEVGRMVRDHGLEITLFQPSATSRACRSRSAPAPSSAPSASST
jgi:4-hydroxyphenylpyruvate dioxygenase